MISKAWTGKVVQFKVDIAQGPQKKFQLRILPHRQNPARKRLDRGD